MIVSRVLQLRMLKDPLDQNGLALERAEASRSRLLELFSVTGQRAARDLLFEITIEVFVEVGFRRAGRQLLNGDGLGDAFPPTL